MRTLGIIFEMDLFGKSITPFRRLFRKQLLLEILRTIPKNLLAALKSITKFYNWLCYISKWKICMSFSLLIPCKLPALCIRNTHSLVICYIVVAHNATYLAFFVMMKLWNVSEIIFRRPNCYFVMQYARSNWLHVGDSKIYVCTYEIQQSQLDETDRPTIAEGTSIL